ncbi:MAG: type II toxin-antitoxin system VapC family toxin [Bifidobacteriaceae bacterium]|nr:type II toxin-antitoxin system VapC family toxin [Bifidobacteriaceae bacterium]
MTIRYLADTNVVVDLLRRPEVLDPTKFAAAEEAIGVSSVTVMELEYGVALSSDPTRNRSEVNAVLSRLRVLPLDQAAAEHSGRIRADLKRLGTPIGPFDSLLAGHARSLGLTLITHNTGEFDRVPGLLTEDWHAE